MAIKSNKKKVVEISGLSKRYGKSNKFAIEGVDVECYEGEIVGLLGKNGAGKSTTIKCLTGFFPFEKGNVKICDCDIKKNPINAKKNLGYVPDNRAMFEKMTGIEYINFVADLHHVSEEDRKARVEDMQKIFKLGDKINSLISSYSHGMKQKIVLISALIHNPKLLILDEPFVGLDPKASYNIKNIMKDFAKNGGAIFFSTHVLEVAEKLCNKVAIIKNGEIIISGDMSKVKKDKSLEKVFLESVDE